jgi:hypothetical protein
VRNVRVRNRVGVSLLDYLKTDIVEDKYLKIVGGVEDIVQV